MIGGQQNFSPSLKISPGILSSLVCLSHLKLPQLLHLKARHNDNTYKDFTYKDFTYKDFTYKDFTYKDFTYNNFTNNINKGDITYMLLIYC